MECPLRYLSWNQPECPSSKAGKRNQHLCRPGWGFPLAHCAAIPNYSRCHQAPERTHQRPDQCRADIKNTLFPGRSLYRVYRPFRRHPLAAFQALQHHSRSYKKSQWSHQRSIEHRAEIENTHDLLDLRMIRKNLYWFQARPLAHYSRKKYKNLYESASQ